MGVPLSETEVRRPSVWERLLFCFARGRAGRIEGGDKGTNWPRTVARRAKKTRLAKNTQSYSFLQDLPPLPRLRT